MTLGPMEATAEVIAQINREVAGYAQTRLTLPVSQGDLIIPVESAFGWPDSGSFLMFGTIYGYAAKTLTTLEGLTWTDGATVFNGVAADLKVETLITDLSKATSAMDLLRRAMLVDTADGADLNVVGRNLGVLRYPFLRDDERFRELIKALAYNPRGTVLGLALVLEALVGTGNYEIFEDVISHPNKVFIRLLGDAAFGDVSAGKVYLRSSEPRPSDSATQVTVNGSVISRGHVNAVRLKPEDHLTDCRTQYPSGDSFVEYTGGPTVNPWVLTGANIVEGTHITQLTPITTENGGIEFTISAPTDVSQYKRAIRATAKADAEMTALVTMPTGIGFEGASHTGLSIDDGTRFGFVGLKPVASQIIVGLTTVGAVGYLSNTIALPLDAYHEIRLKKIGDVCWEIYVNGALLDSVPYATVPVTGGTAEVAFGHYDTTAANKLRVKQAGYKYRDPTDYWGVQASDGVSGFPTIDRFTTASGAFVSGDVGRQLVLNHSNDAFRSLWWVIYNVVSGTIVDVRGKNWPGTAELGVAASNRIVIDENNPQQFIYPDDLSKQIEVVNSGVGNDGIYNIIALLDPVTLTDFSTYDTPNTEHTNIAVIAGSLTPESNAEWRLLPVFPAGSGIDWEMPGAGTEASSVLTLRTPSTLPHPTVVEVDYSEVLGGNLLFDAQILNTILQADPLLLEYYPFYINDPLGFIRQYLDAVTAAGVIPDYDF